MPSSPETRQFRPLAITGVGALSPIGGCASQTCASLRAGLNVFGESAIYDVLTGDPEWDDPEPVVASAVSSVNAESGPERLMALALPALREALASASLTRKQMAKTALIVAGPESTTVPAEWLAETLHTRVQARAGLSALPLVIGQSWGHAGGLKLLEEASRLLSTPQIDHVVLLGVDTYLTSDRLQMLDETWRIKSTRNVDGFLPGEAAGALVLQLNKGAKVPALGVIQTVASANEPKSLRSEHQSSATALCEVLRQVCAPEARRFLLSDQNGESYRAFEWGLAVTRLGTQLGELVDAPPPVMSLGDTGAASACLFIASALAAFGRGYAPTPEALVYCASDSGLRAAARITAHAH